MSHRVCLLQPGPCSPSETAIGNHTRLFPARVHVIAGPRRSRPARRQKLALADARRQAKSKEEGFARSRSPASH